MWPQDWTIECVISWIASADDTYALLALGVALDETFDTLDELTHHLLARKSYAPTHETVAATLMANEACRNRTGTLLSSLSDTVTGAELPPGASPLFRVEPALSTEQMLVYRMAT